MGRPEDFNTKSTLRPFREWDKENPEAAQLWKDVIGQLNLLWRQDFYLKEPETADVAQAILASSPEAQQERATRQKLTALLGKLCAGSKPLSPLLKQMMTAWEDRFEIGGYGETLIKFVLPWACYF